MTKPKAHIARVDEDLEDKMTEALEWLSWQDIVKPQTKVMVKPNLTWPFHKPGVTVSPEFLAALLKVLKTRAGNIKVCESDKSDRAYKARDTFSGHGLYDICEHLDVELINLTEMESRMINENVGGKNVSIPLPVPLLDEDMTLISVPVLKTHSLTGISAGMKNLWGLIPDPMRLLYHPIFDEANALINKVLAPRLVVIDAIYVQDGNGPFLGEPVRMDTMIAANGIAASEPVSCAFMGLRPEDISHLAFAKRLGMLAELDEIETNEDIEKFRTHDFKPTKTWLNHISAYLFKHTWANDLVYDSMLTRLSFRVLNLLKEDKMGRDRDAVRGKDNRS